jgi:hypothetical protein
MNRQSLRHYGHNGKSPRQMSGHPYLFRRETSVFVGREPGLDITSKLKEKEGLFFKGAPDFYRLSPSDVNTNKTMSNEDLKEQSEKQQKDEEKRKKKQKEAPSVSEVREHLRSIILFHAKEVEKNFPSAYPLLGPAGERDDEESGGSSAPPPKRAKKK